MIEGADLKAVSGGMVSISREPGAAREDFPLFGISTPRTTSRAGEASRERLAYLLEKYRPMATLVPAPGGGQAVLLVTPAGEDVSRRMARDGFAREHDAGDKAGMYRAAERDAQRARRGLWGRGPSQGGWGAEAPPKDPAQTLDAVAMRTAAAAQRAFDIAIDLTDWQNAARLGGVILRGALFFFRYKTVAYKIFHFSSAYFFGAPSRDPSLLYRDAIPRPENARGGKKGTKT